MITLAFALIVLAGISWMVYLGYLTNVTTFMRDVVSCNMTGRLKYLAPTPFRSFLVKHLQFRIRRVDTVYQLEARTFLVDWYNVPVSSHSSAEFYGRWWHASTHDVELAKRRLSEVRADVDGWLEQSKTFDYTQVDNRVIEVVKYSDK